MSSSEHFKLRHARVKEILFEASQLEGKARSEFLDRACAGDRELRDEVESLLSYHEERGEGGRRTETARCEPPLEAVAEPEAPKSNVTPLPSAPSDRTGRGGERKCSR